MANTTGDLKQGSAFQERKTSVQDMQPIMYESREGVKGRLNCASFDEKGKAVLKKFQDISDNGGQLYRGG